MLAPADERADAAEGRQGEPDAELRAGRELGADATDTHATGGEVNQSPHRQRHAVAVESLDDDVLAFKIVSAEGATL